MQKAGLIFMIGGLAALVPAVISFIDFFFISGLYPVPGGLGMLLVLTVFIVCLRWLMRWLRSGGRFSISDLFWMAIAYWVVEIFYYGLLLGDSAIDIQLHDTYYVMTGKNVFIDLVLLFGLMGSIYYLFRKITGRDMQMGLGGIHFIVTFGGSVLFFQYGLYLISIPHGYMDIGRWEGYNRMEVRIVLAVAAAQVLFIFNLVYSAVRGKKSPN